MKYLIPEVGEIEITTIVLDLNGTLSVKGKISDEAKKLIQQLRDADFELLLLTGDQRGTAEAMCGELGIQFIRCKNGDEKYRAMESLDSQTTAAIGNARIDIGTFKQAKIRVATLQAEGIHTGILEYVDIIIPSIEDALRLFLDESTMAATMRT